MIENSSSDSAIEEIAGDNKKLTEDPEKAIPCDQEKKQVIKMFIFKNSKFLPEGKTKEIEDKLMKLSIPAIQTLCCLDFINPRSITALSCLFGHLGIDRFMIGHTRVGLIKVLGCFGIVYCYNYGINKKFDACVFIAVFIIFIIGDMFRINGITRYENYKKLERAIESLA